MAMNAQPLARAQWNDGMVLHALHPAVHEQTLLGHEHALRELQDLPGRIVVVTALAGELSGLRQAGHAHVQIVEPQ